MKKIISLFCFSFLFLAAFSQSNVVPDPRIYEVYPDSKVVWMLENNIERIVQLNVILNAYEVVQLENYQGQDPTTLEVLNVNEIESINLLKLNLAPKPNQEQWFYLINQNALLKILEEGEAFYLNKSNSTF